MLEASLAALPRVQGVIASAAVMDYRVSRPATGKLKRASESVRLEMEPSVDVLGGLRERARDGQWFLGFAAETDDPVDHGRGKLEKKRLDFLFANRVARAGERLDGGFGSDNNAGWLLRPGREPEELGHRSKTELARTLWDVLARETR
jgi:phosphopantothenoylcysteine decarboxylase/phosphopantothenate--cysteine ligase